MPAAAHLHAAASCNVFGAADKDPRPGGRCHDEVHSNASVGERTCTFVQVHSSLKRSRLRGRNRPAGGSLREGPLRGGSAPRAEFERNHWECSSLKRSRLRVVPTAEPLGITSSLKRSRPWRRKRRGLGGEGNHRGGGLLWRGVDLRGRNRSAGEALRRGEPLRERSASPGGTAPRGLHSLRRISSPMDCPWVASERSEAVGRDLRREHKRGHGVARQL
jgi:hypothetical protein